MKRPLAALALVSLQACSSSGDPPGPDAASPTPDAAEVSTPDAKVPADAGPPDAMPAAPVFVKPTGTSVTLDLRAQACVNLDIMIEDADTARVTLRQEAPVIQGATLSQTGDHSGAWMWCPTQSQIDFADLWTLKLSADDGTFPPVLRELTIMLRRP